VIFVARLWEPGCYNASVTADEKEPGPSEAPSSGYIYVRREVLYGLVLALTFALGLGAGYLIWGSADAAAPAEEVSTAAGRIEVSLDDDPRIGPADAPITIVEFSDFNCPYCRAWQQQTFPSLMETFPEQIQFVYKDFPVVGGGTIGEGAAQAANCAAEQDGYWEYHDALFSGQFELNRAGFEQAAIDTGLDGEALLNCLDSGRYAEEVQQDLRYGAGLGVTGTPTFFINGIPMVGAQPLLRFMEVINGELGGS
jgi:protein-disulfide isomerase